VLAQEFCREHSGRVTRLVLADTYAGWRGSLEPPVVQQRVRRCENDSYLEPQEFASRWVDEMFSAHAPPTLLAEMSAILSDFHPQGFRSMARSLADTDTTDVLRRLEVPTLVLWGEADRRSPLSIGEQLRNAISGAELHVIPRAGHVSNMEQPDAFNAEVRSFCRSTTFVE
jgi:pimeloyl-ACP methyl ester carboxylesterase